MGFRILFSPTFTAKMQEKFGHYRTCIKIDFCSYYSLKNPEERHCTKEFWEEYIQTFPEEKDEYLEWMIENFEEGCILEGLY